MSDERRTGSVAFLAERLQHCAYATGSLKRKLGETIPVSRQYPASYPSPPMSNPPSPLRPSAHAFPVTTVEQSAGVAAHQPSPRNIQENEPFSTTSVQQSAAPSPFVFPAGLRSEPTTSSAGPLQSQESVSSLPSGQDVFAVASEAVPAAPSKLSTSPSTTRTGRKAKAHVASACMNCKRAHLSCDTQRPCTRCVTSGKQDSCFDVPHKKRGRPRLREENEFKVDQMVPEQAGHAAMPMTPMGAGPSAGRPIARTRHQRTESLRSLRSQTSEGSSGSSLPTPGYPPILQAGWSYSAPRPPSSGLSASLVPTAFLDLDFNFIRANRPFKQILANDQEVRGRRLEDVVAPTDGENFMGLRGRLKGERETREPAYMPPMLQPGEDPIQGVTEDDVERLAAGFSDQTHTWTRSAPGQQGETFPARLRLAKATSYFVVFTLPSFRPIEMLPPQPAAQLPAGYMIPPPRAPILSSQTSDPRFDSQRASPASQQPYGLPYPPAQYQGRSYPSIQPYPPGIGYATPSQRQSQPTTPRLPAAEPPMQITPITPLTAAPRQQQPLAPAIQLPPLAAAPRARASMPPIATSSIAEAQQTASSDDEASPKKRRRMDISDVLQR